MHRRSGTFLGFLNESEIRIALRSKTGRGPSRLDVQKSKLDVFIFLDLDVFSGCLPTSRYFFSGRGPRHPDPESPDIQISGRLTSRNPDLTSRNPDPDIFSRAGMGIVANGCKLEIN